MLGSKIEPPQPTKVKKLGLTGSASSEFAKRFLTKPTRQPKVIDFNAGNVHVEKKRRGINGFFPPMKLRVSSRNLSAKSTDQQNNAEPNQNAETAQQILYINGNPTVSVLSSTANNDPTTGDDFDSSNSKPTNTLKNELTHTNIEKHYPREINIPIVDIGTETDESGSMRAVDATIQFKLPPVIIGEISENDIKQDNTRGRCTACNVPEKAGTDMPNIWLIHQDVDHQTRVNYEDFTNAILGHFPVLNFRFRREWTIRGDRKPCLTSLAETVPMLSTNTGVTLCPKISGNTDKHVALHSTHTGVTSCPKISGNADKNVALHSTNTGVTSSPKNTDSADKEREKCTLELMKHMTREIYTSFKLSKTSSRAKEDRLQLVPTSFSEVRPRSNMSRAMSRASRRSFAHQRKTPVSVRAVPAHSAGTYPSSYPETFDCDDLSFLPPPKRILPRRDVPWVFRYKVKKNMNELSKILASKPQQTVEGI